MTVEKAPTSGYFGAFESTFHPYRVISPLIPSEHATDVKGSEGLS